MEEVLNSERYEKIFFGSQFAIALNRYDTNHVGFYILNEDDGNWFTSESFSSSYWIPDLQVVLQDALTWVKENCDEFKPDNCGGAIMGWLWRTR